MLKKLIFSIGMVAVLQSATADVVTDWNNVALDTIRATNEVPPRAARALAMMHIAIYDAVNGIEQDYEPYFITKYAPKGASPEAAAAVAAYTVLVGLYPARAAEFDAALSASLAAVPQGPAKAKGKSWGNFCGKGILKLRKNDGADTEVIYVPSGELGHWEPTPPDFSPALLPQWPYSKPFAMISGDQFRSPPPPLLESIEYANAFNEVKALGEINSLIRTVEQTEIAYFWEDGRGTVTPPGHWQVIAQQIAERYNNTLLENARLFALLSIAQADGAILCWDNKYYYDYVRPYTAITQIAYVDDGNPDTEVDPNWFPLLPTPPFPAYTSGHSTFSGTSSKILELFFGTDAIAFSAASPDPHRWPDVLPGVVRSWESLSQAAEEAGQSRIYGGIHWQYDNTEGLKGGHALAEYVFENYLRPLD